MAKLTKWVVFDLDGCVFDDRHRQPLIDKVHRLYDAYHAQMSQDRATWLGKRLVSHFLNAGFNILFITARPEKWRKDTLVQFRRELNLCDETRYHLFMRPEHMEHVPSPRLKESLIRECTAQHGDIGDVVMAFDDRQDVCEMWRDLDIPAYVLNHEKLYPSDYLERMREIASKFNLADLPDDSGQSYEFGCTPKFMPTQSVKVYNSDRILIEAINHIIYNNIHWIGGEFTGNLIPYTDDNCHWYKDVSRDWPTEPVEVSVPVDCNGIPDFNQAYAIHPQKLKNMARTTSKCNSPVKPFSAASLNREPMHQPNCRCRSTELSKIDLESLYELKAPAFSYKDALDLLDKQTDNKITKRIAADVLEEAAATFRERNAVYKDNSIMVGKVMAALFPDGVTCKTPDDWHIWHLFELLVVKLTRFANSDMTHQDSARDSAVYWAMVETLLGKHTINFNRKEEK